MGHLLKNATSTIIFGRELYTLYPTSLRASRIDVLRSCGKAANAGGVRLLSRTGMAYVRRGIEGQHGRMIDLSYTSSPPTRHRIQWGVYHRLKVIVTHGDRHLHILIANLHDVESSRPLSSLSDCQWIAATRNDA